MLVSLRLGRAALAGFLGTLAMTMLMYAWPVVGLPRMDLLAALGSVFPFDLSPYIAGTVVHLAIGIFLAAAYVLLFEPWLPGPAWLRGALFSLLPWFFAITLLSPSLRIASDLFRGKGAVITANPCAVSNPCAVRPANPCAANPCAPIASNPCAPAAHPCATANPCVGGAGSTGALPPQVMSLIVHLVYGVVLGAAYKGVGSYRSFTEENSSVLG